MRFIESVFQKLKRHPKRIVFPEGTEPRILHAACQFVKLQIGAPLLLGKKDAIEAVAHNEKVNVDRIGIIDPESSSDLSVFCERLEKFRRYRDLGPQQTRDLMLNPNYFGAMMVQHGQADGLVGGASVSSGALLRPLFQLIKPLPDVELISSCTMLEGDRKRFGEDGVLFFADCAVIPEPTVEQLAHIALQTGRICRQLTGMKPRVAMLSYSTRGSARQRSVEKMAAATALAKQKADREGLEMEIEGEIQADAAVVPAIGKLKAPSSLVAGHANVLIFPDLNSANISVKLVEHLTGADAYGQILLGLSKPCAEVSRGATVDDILGVAAIVGLQAIEYRKLYPPQELESAGQPA